ncbi:MAG: hypothetical protein M3081_22745 [Gemmatimonadota bacterium]|nr:hypothetical protein [Gemmatimonadota bacterium]
MAITLVQFWQQERDIHEAAQTAAQTDLGAAQLALVAAKAKLDADVATLNALNTAIAANRAKLAVTSVPSDVTALNNTIRDQIVEQRTLQGGIMDDQDMVAWSQGGADGATATLARATARKADAEAKLAAANDANKQRQMLMAQLTLAPFDTLQTDAGSHGALETAAQAEIDANLPTELQTIAGKRYATRAARAAQLKQSLSDAEDALGTSLGTTDGFAGDAAKKEIDFKHKERRLREYAAAAKQRYDRAVAVLTDLTAIKDGTKTPDLLTAQEKLDVASSAARTTAESNALPADTNRATLYTARNDLDTQIATQIGTDVDKLATDATVKAKRDAVTAAAGALKTTQDGIVASGDKAVLDQWEVVVQDTAWRTFIDYLDAKAALTELAGTAPATLASDLVTAEDAYAVALAKATKAQRAADAFADVIALRAQRADASSAALSGRLLSAVRGDSF